MKLMKLACDSDGDDDDVACRTPYSVLLGAFAQATWGSCIPSTWVGSGKQMQQPPYYSSTDYISVSFFSQTLWIRGGDDDADACRNATRHEST